MIDVNVKLNKVRHSPACDRISEKQRWDDVILSLNPNVDDYITEPSDIHTFTSKSVFTSQISTGKTQNRPLASTGNSYNFNVKITHFARNRKVKISLRRETLVSEIPARLSPYTVLLNYFLHTINFSQTFPRTDWMQCEIKFSHTFPRFCWMQV